MERWLATRDDIAALILEPTGATFGQIPTTVETLRRLRELTTRYGVLLIFDEVISGFRCSPGGAQQFHGVIPDLTTLAKILAGGYPGAALAGRADLLRVLDYRKIDDGLQFPLVVHQGTYNPAPVSAAAGIATLEQVRGSDAIDRSQSNCGRDSGWNQLRYSPARIAMVRIWTVFGLSLVPRGNAWPEDIYAGEVPWSQLKGAVPLELVNKIRAGFLLHGVDIAALARRIRFGGAHS